MKLYRFDRDSGIPVEAFGSANVTIARLARLSGAAQISCLYLAPGGQVGWHPAASAQLFAVVQGYGWVTGGDGERLPIRAGLAAFWTREEWHSAESDPGLVAIVIESDALHPEGYLPSA